MIFKNILYKIGPKKLFLIDSLGATISALLLSQLLARFEAVFGMPKCILYTLSIIACFLALYSLLCYIFKMNNWRPYLKLIAIANFIYCISTIVLIIDQFQDITFLGHLYFTLELCIVIALAIFEFKTASNKLDI